MGNSSGRGVRQVQSSLEGESKPIEQVLALGGERPLVKLIRTVDRLGVGKNVGQHHGIA